MNTLWSAGRRRGANVLVVDDDAAYLEIAEAFLSMRGYNASGVRNGCEALKWIEQNGHPDVILLDYNMPVMNGQDFMQAYDGSAHIVIITGWSKLELPYEPFKTLYKPFNPDSIVSTIEAALAPANGPKWKRFLPCDHACVTLNIQEQKLIFTCPIPGCEKSKAVHKDHIDFETVLELTVSIAEDAFAREEKTNLS